MQKTAVKTGDKYRTIHIDKSTQVAHTRGASSWHSVHPWPFQFCPASHMAHGMPMRPPAHSPGPPPGQCSEGSPHRITAL